MKRSIRLLLSLSALFVAGSAGAEEGRFDAQVFRPAAAPRDLVMVQKSEVIGHFSPTVGFYYDVALNPLELAVNDTGRTMDAVAARLQLTALAAVGLAVAGNINLPTGNENAFTSDGVLTGGVMLITDYRFNFGLILARLYLQGAQRE